MARHHLKPVGYSNRKAISWRQIIGLSCLALMTFGGLYYMRTVEDLTGLSRLIIGCLAFFTLMYILWMLDCLSSHKQ